MQNPPPSSAPASSGIDKRTGALLSYLVTWVTGLIFLFVGKNDPDVKYHAAQSVVFFGALTILQIAFNIIGSFVPYIGIVATLLGLVQFIWWIICLYKAWTGNGARFEVPVFGSFIRPYVDQLMGAVN